jgi:hypothetical protein
VDFHPLTSAKSRSELFFLLRRTHVASSASRADEPPTPSIATKLD